jgi:hypothetical protein
LSTLNKYTISNFTSNWAVGDISEDYTLIISKEDYQRIYKEIEMKTYFQKLNTGKIPIQAYNLKSDLTKINETACKYDNTFFYQIFNPKLGLVVTVVLERDSLMQISYKNL